MASRLNCTLFRLSYPLFQSFVPPPTHRTCCLRRILSILKFEDSRSITSCRSTPDLINNLRTSLNAPPFHPLCSYTAGTESSKVITPINMPGKQVSLILVGYGGVGSVFHTLVQNHNNRQAKQDPSDPLYGYTFNIVALVDSSGYIANSAGLDETTLVQATTGKKNGVKFGKADGGVEGKASEFLPRLYTGTGNTIIVDCSATDAITDAFLVALEQGVGVVFANKKCLCKAYPDRGPNQFNIPANKLVGYESTVGAGTPFISTVKRLMAAGDVPKMIMGTFSGSVNYIFSELAKLTDDKTAGDLDFQKIVMAARAKGFTEPDPRDDLSGTDVQRKVLILARSMGVFGLEMDDIKVTPLYPDSMASLSIPDFMDALATQNDSWKARVQAADKEGKVLRFAAKVEREGYTDDFRGGKIKCSVGVEAVSKDSPLGLLSGTTNIMMIVSDYNSTTQPLVVQGPGAGNQITAAGCLADCVYIADTFNY